MLPVIMGHSPAGAAAKQMIHFGQVTRAQRFRQYDYGALNLQIHGQLTPPLYDLSRISTPIYMYHSTNDWMATPEDVALLHAELPNVALKYLVSMPEFNHMDFVWAINVRSLLYNRVIQSMREAEANL
jgi:lysosomal acid lipase/cholesteryl ester hydrolase